MKTHENKRIFDPLATDIPVPEPWFLRKPVGERLGQARAEPECRSHGFSRVGRIAPRITRWSLVGRIVVVWCTIREVIHDRIEPLLGESEELLAHLAPQLAAFV